MKYKVLELRLSLLSLLLLSWSWSILNIWLSLVLRDDLNRLFFLWFDNDDRVRQWLGETSSSFWVVWSHDLNLQTQDTLLEKNVSDSVVDEISDRLTRVNHESIGELHSLGSGSSKLTRNNDLATLSARFHDESDNTVTSTTNSKTTKELVSQ